MRSLNKFYSYTDNFNKLNDVLNSKTKISLRLIEYFMTKYIFANSADDYLFRLSVSYKTSQLKSYSKKQFDPFCRRNKLNKNKIILKNSEITIETNCGQLNFFKWAFENDIIKYIREHFDTIEKQMKKYDKEKTLEKKAKALAKAETKANNNDKTLCDYKVNDNLNIKGSIEIDEDIKITIKFD